jgi:hypothetical protein
MKVDDEREDDGGLQSKVDVDGRSKLLINSDEG